MWTVLVKIVNSSLFAALIGAGVLVTGWSVVSHQDDERAVTNRQRQLRTEYLIEAFRAIETARRNPEIEEDRKKMMSMEGAITDIQLLGDKKQVRLALDLSKSLNNGGDAMKLLKNLRQELRKELRLEPINGNLFIFRWQRPSPPKASNANSR